MRERQPSDGVNLREDLAYVKGRTKDPRGSCDEAD